FLQVGETLEVLFAVGQCNATRIQRNRLLELKHNPCRCEDPLCLLVYLRRYRDRTTGRLPNGRIRGVIYISHKIGPSFEDDSGKRLSSLCHRCYKVAAPESYEARIAS